MNIFTKVINKIIYIVFRILLWLLHLITSLFIVIAPLIKKRKPKYDLALYPYSQKGSDGYTRRFEEYFPYLTKDNISYKVFDVCTDEESFVPKKRLKLNYYLFYLFVFFKRLYQVISIRNYKRAFIHRNLFLFYSNQKIPILEKLAYELCDYVVLDYWDSVWVSNKTLVNRTVNYCHSLSVVNDFIADHFSYLDKSKELFPIGVNLEKYIVKQIYSLGSEDCLTFFYTGQPWNVRKMFGELTDVFDELSKKFKLKLILVSREKYDSPFIEVEHHTFSEDNFFELIAMADIGIYGIEDSVISRGKMAMKVLDYAAAGLPCVASPYGITPYAINDENILFAETNQEWINNIIQLYNDEQLRRKLGQNARKMMENYHSLDQSYKRYKEIMQL